MKKVIDVDASPVLYDEPLIEKSISEQWKVYGGEWKVEEGWLTGKNPENNPGMIICKMNFPGNVLLDFEARTVPPCTHDINVMWNGSWDEKSNRRDIAYVAGLEGWWEGKVGIEKSPEYKLNAGTPLFNFRLGNIYHIQCGSVDGHCFVFADGKLMLEVTDPDPIDYNQHTKVGFEAYCSHIQVRNLVIRQIKWNPIEICYSPEF